MNARTTASYSAVPSADLEDVARPQVDPKEAAHRKQLRVRIRTESGVAIGWAVWREELNRWEARDDRYHLLHHRPTFARCESLVRRLVRCKTLEEARRCR